MGEGEYRTGRSKHLQQGCVAVGGEGEEEAEGGGDKESPRTLAAAEGEREPTVTAPNGRLAHKERRSNHFGSACVRSRLSRHIRVLCGRISATVDMSRYHPRHAYRVYTRNSSAFPTRALATVTPAMPYYTYSYCRQAQAPRERCGGRSLWEHSAECGRMWLSFLCFFPSESWGRRVQKIDAV